MRGGFLNRNGFFSDYFVSSLFEEPSLKTLLPSESDWRSARSRLSSLYRRLYGRFGESTRGGETRDRWLFPLFRELGFSLSESAPVDVEGQMFRCSHQFVPEGADGPAALLDLVAWADEFDRSPPGTVRRPSPHRNMLQLLEGTGVRWGLLANGESLRLLRLSSEGSGQEYLEFNFPALLLEPSVDNETDFALLWSLCRAQAFLGEGEPGCLLDRLQELSEQRGSRVSEELKGSVFLALERLVRGIISRHDNWGASGLGRYLDDPDGVPHPADLTDAALKDIYRQSLIFLFRCLFVLYAESRDLLPTAPAYATSYSLSQLREQLLQPGEWHPSGTGLWDALRAIFRIMERGLMTDEFVVPAYNGGLFEPERTPVLSECARSAMTS